MSGDQPNVVLASILAGQQEKSTLKIFWQPHLTYRSVVKWTIAQNGKMPQQAYDQN